MFVQYNLLYPEAACFGPNISSSGCSTCIHVCSLLLRRAVFIIAALCLISATDGGVRFGTYLHINLSAHYVGILTIGH